MWWSIPVPEEAQGHLVEEVVLLMLYSASLYNLTESLSEAEL